MDRKLPKLIVAGLVEKDGKFLLIEEVLENNKKYWIVPGGHVEFGETLESALQREIKEETGFDVDIIKFLGFNEAIFPANNYHTIIFFYLVKPIAGTLITDEKATGSGFFSKEEMRNLNLVTSAKWLLENKL